MLTAGMFMGFLILQTGHFLNQRAVLVEIIQQAQ
jgi:hypothetical protein